MDEVGEFAVAVSYDILLVMLLSVLLPSVVPGLPRPPDNLSSGPGICKARLPYRHARLIGISSERVSIHDLLECDQTNQTPSVIAIASTL